MLPKHGMGWGFKMTANLCEISGVYAINGKLFAVIYLPIQRWMTVTLNKWHPEFFEKAYTVYYTPRQHQLCNLDGKKSPRERD